MKSIKKTKQGESGRKGQKKRLKREEGEKGKGERKKRERGENVYFVVVNQKRSFL